PKAPDAPSTRGTLPKATPSAIARRRRAVEPRTLPLLMPVIGMEAEFNVIVDGVESVPLAHWSHPREFIRPRMLPRTKGSSQLPTGGAVYFDKGVIEVATPPIEIAPGCAARVARNLWDHIGFVRGELT